MIKFIQHSSSRYPPRTYENASADLTIAFAFDASTPGEKLTYEAVKSQGKLYIQIQPHRLPLEFEKISYAAQLIENKNVSTINIAGNGLYTTIKFGYDQAKCDELVYNYLYSIITHLHDRNQIKLIRSGGQSGFDESGLKAAEKLGIPALCVCPKGWRFCDINFIDISDEQKFKNRFNSAFIL